MKKTHQFEKSYSPVIDTARCRELIMVCSLIILAIGCGMLYALMEKNWAVNSDIRERVLLVAGFLFTTSFAVCYCIIKSIQEQKSSETTQKTSHTELSFLLTDRPPTYESIREELPPSYKAVITGSYIVPCHTTHMYESRC